MVDTEYIVVAASAGQEVENVDQEFDTTNHEVHNTNAEPVIPITVNLNNRNEIQVSAVKTTLSTLRRTKRVGDLTKPESDFVRKVGKKLMTDGKMVRASDLLLAYNSEHPGYTRDESQLKNSWQNFKDSKAFKPFRDSIEI